MLTAEVNYGALAGNARLSKRLVDATLREVVKATGARGNVSIGFVSEAQMRRLNRTHRGKDRVTDVLSFELDEGDLLGEVLICYDQAKRQAHEMGHATRHELVFLLVHGALHLLGYDHERQADRKRMFALQTRILKRLGVDLHV